MQTKTKNKIPRKHKAICNDLIIKSKDDNNELINKKQSQ